MREQVGAGSFMVGGDLNLPAGHGLDCEDVSANGQKHANNTAQLPWPGKRRKMFLKKLATVEMKHHHITYKAWGMKGSAQRKQQIKPQNHFA